MFLLGAGFSNAVHKAMPVLRDLSGQVRLEVEQSEGGSVLQPLLTFGENIELWLTYLGQPQPWLKAQSAHKNKALFLAMTEAIEKAIAAQTRVALQEDPPAWLGDLVEVWKKKKSKVITFNYDTLVERAAGGEHLVYTIRMVEISGGSTLTGKPPDGVPSFSLLKLHGSVNWYYSGAEQFFGETIYYSSVGGWSRSETAERRSTILAQPLTPLIVPPTSEKGTYFMHERIRFLWAEAAEALRSATRVFAIGYSLPTTDLGARFLLLYGGDTSSVPLYVVNKNPDSVEHYRDLVGAAFDVRSDYAGPKGIERMTGSLS